MKGNVEPINVPLKEPFRIATGEVTAAKNVLFHVSQDGIAGVGEASPFAVITGCTQASVQSDLAKVPSDFDLDPTDIGKTLKAVGADKFGSDSRNALDVALHDWAARKKGVPLATFLGGSPRPLATSITIPIVPLDQVAKHVRNGLDAGFGIFKVKSKAGVDEETKRIKLVRDTAGKDVEIRVDANAGWSLQEAKQMLPVLARNDVIFLEQPLKREDHAGHAELTKIGTLPIMVDESIFTFEDAKKLHKAKAANIFNVKLAKTGGITEAARIFRFAEQEGIDCMLGCMIQTRIATSQDAHVAAGFKVVKYVDLDGHTFLASDPIEGGVTIQKGKLVFPTTPGHGARWKGTSAQVATTARARN